METSALLDHHRSAGAQFTPAAPDDSGLLLTYGDVPAEYQAAAEGAVLFDQTDRGLVIVRGEERAQFLHRLLANRVRELNVGSGNRNLLLTSKGKIVHDFDLSVEAEEIRLSTRAGTAQALRDALDMYHFTEKVELEVVTDQSAPLAITGPKAESMVEGLLGQLPPESPAPTDEAGSQEHRPISVEWQGQTVRVTRLPVAGSSGLRLDGGPAAAPLLWKALCDQGAQPAGRILWDILRVEAGAAESGADIDDSIYPQEARAENGFSLEKGCYIGQEVVAKIDTYGGLNKRLTALKVSHDDPIAPGTRLYRQDGDGPENRRDLGVITSWAYSFVLDTGLVLAYVKRKHQALGNQFEIGEADGANATAEVVTLPVRTQAIPITGAFE